MNLPVIGFHKYLPLKIQKSLSEKPKTSLAKKVTLANGGISINNKSSEKGKRATLEIHQLLKVLFKKKPSLKTIFSQRGRNKMPIIIDIISTKNPTKEQTTHYNHYTRTITLNLADLDGTYLTIKGDKAKFTVSRLVLHELLHAITPNENQNKLDFKSIGLEDHEEQIITQVNDLLSEEPPRAINPSHSLNQTSDSNGLSFNRRSIESITNAFNFYALPGRESREPRQPLIFAMSRPAGPHGDEPGTVEEYGRLLDHNHVGTVINFSRGYEESNENYFSSVRDRVQVIDLPENYMVDDVDHIPANERGSYRTNRRRRRGEFLVARLIRAIEVIDSANPIPSRPNITINCAAGNGRSGTILAALFIRHLVQRGEPLQRQIDYSATGTSPRERTTTPVYEIVHRAIERIRANNPLAVESSVHIQALNRYYEYLTAKKSSHPNKFRYQESGGANSRSDDDPSDGGGSHSTGQDYNRGFWSQWWHNIETLADNLLHHQNRINFAALEKAWIDSSPLINNKRKRNSIEQSSGPISFNIHTSEDRAGPFLLATEKIEDILSTPNSWLEEASKKEVKVHVWEGQPYIQFEYQYDEGHGQFRVFQTIDISESLQRTGLNPSDSLSASQLRDILRNAPTRYITAFGSSNDGTISTIKNFIFDDEDAIDNFTSMRALKDNNGQVYVELGGIANWVPGKFLPSNTPWPSAILGDRPSLLFLQNKQEPSHTNFQYQNLLFPSVNTYIIDPLIGDIDNPETFTPFEPFYPEENAPLSNLPDSLIRMTDASPLPISLELKTEPKEGDSGPNTISIPIAPSYKIERGHRSLQGNSRETLTLKYAGTFKAQYSRSNSPNATWRHDPIELPVTISNSSSLPYSFEEISSLNSPDQLAAAKLGQASLNNTLELSTEPTWKSWRQTFINKNQAQQTANHIRELANQRKVIQLSSGAMVIPFTAEDITTLGLPNDNAFDFQDHREGYGVIYLDSRGRLLGWDKIGFHHAPYIRHGQRNTRIEITEGYPTQLKSSEDDVFNKFDQENAGNLYIWGKADHPISIKSHASLNKKYNSNDQYETIKQHAKKLADKFYTDIDNKLTTDQQTTLLKGLAERNGLEIHMDLEDSDGNIFSNDFYSFTYRYHFPNHWPEGAENLKDILYLAAEEFYTQAYAKIHPQEGAINIENITMSFRVPLLQKNIPMANQISLNNRFQPVPSSIKLYKDDHESSHYNKITEHTNELAEQYYTYFSSQLTLEQQAQLLEKLSTSAPLTMSIDLNDDDGENDEYRHSFEFAWPKNTRADQIDLKTYFDKAAEAFSNYMTTKIRDDRVDIDGDGKPDIFPINPANPDILPDGTEKGDDEGAINIVNTDIKIELPLGLADFVQKMLF